MATDAFTIFIIIFLISRFLFHAYCSHIDTLGAEKKSGVPYILMSDVRHRQTPTSKHDQKIRHVGLAHVAQPSYLAYSYFGEVSHQAQYAVAYVPGSFRDFPAPRSAALSARLLRGSGLGLGHTPLPYGHLPYFRGGV